MSSLARSRADSRSTSFSESMDGSMAATELMGKAKGTATVPEEAKLEESKSGNEPEVISVEETLSSRNIRVAVVGNVDAGKSTLIGTLTTSFLDDGRGSSRTAIMKHRHEIESGRTSTSSSHLLGFKHSGEVVVGREKHRANRMKTDDEIAKMSYRIVTLMDLAGHEKYLKVRERGSFVSLSNLPTQLNHLSLDYHPRGFERNGGLFSYSRQQPPPSHAHDPASSELVLLLY